MKKLLLILLFPSILLSQQSYSDFFKAVVNNQSNAADYVDPEELQRSQRLGITYTGVTNKFLISFDINDDVKQQIIQQEAPYTFTIPSGESSYKAVEFAMRYSKYRQMFYFRDGKFIAPSAYFTHDWQTRASKYFVFKISEPKYFNDYCVKRLDDFVDALADMLGFTANEKALLKKEKLYYIFCKDEDEVQKITGYMSKGQSVLAFDEVVTAYQTHFHEVAHLLINYKLKKLGLYTNPFFMEGFAVAVGGRGGMAPRVETDVGYYLQKTAFLTYDSILTYDAFMSQDANMTYAVSGMYNTFLMKSLGMPKYLDLYKGQNGGFEFVRSLAVDKTSLPGEEKFEKFMQNVNDNRVLFINEKDTTKPQISAYSIGYIPVLVNGIDKYFLYDDMFFTTIKLSKTDSSYISRKFLSTFPFDSLSAKSPPQYYVTADSLSISVYNFYNDELLASYNKYFSVDMRQVPEVNHKYEFFIKPEIFDENKEHETMYEGLRLKSKLRQR